SRSSASDSTSGAGGSCATPGSGPTNTVVSGTIGKVEDTAGSTTLSSLTDTTGSGTRAWRPLSYQARKPTSPTAATRAMKSSVLARIIGFGPRSEFIVGLVLQQVRGHDHHHFQQQALARFRRKGQQYRCACDHGYRNQQRGTEMLLPPRNTAAQGLHVV